VLLSGAIGAVDIKGVGLTKTRTTLLRRYMPVSGYEPEEVRVVSIR